jgi:preprotein translocase subunit SecA
MAGRGTDIVLGEGVDALGGLHVLSLQDNPSRRLDRQLTGRSARAGDAGSHELWQVLDGPLHHRSSWLRACRNWSDRDGALKLSQGWLERLAHAAQEHEERKTAGQRRRLLEQDLEWERRLHPES